MADHRGGKRVSLSATGYRSVLNLRGRPDDPVLASAIGDALGVGLPLTPNRWRGGGARMAIWLGPDEWLLLAPDGEARNIERRLRDAAGKDPWFAVVDVSHHYTGFRLTGEAAREVLAKGCPLDLHRSRFRPGHCAQSVLAGTRILLRTTSEPDSIELWVRNSFARYTERWLCDAMAEFGGSARAGHASANPAKIVIGVTNARQ